MKKCQEPRECWKAHISQDSSTPSLVLRHSVSTPQCGRAKNYTLSGWDLQLSLSRVLLMKSRHISPTALKLPVVSQGSRIKFKL